MTHRLRSLGAALLLAIPLCAQPVPQIPDIGPIPLPLPEAQVGVPYEPPVNEYLDQIGRIAATSPEVSVSLTVEGSPPPGISVSGTGHISGTPTAAGVFSFRIIYRFSGSSGGITVSVRLLYDAMLTVRGAPGGLGVKTPSLAFSAIQGGTASPPQSIVIENRGAQPRTLSAAASARTGTWLSASGGVTVSPFSTATIAVNADPSGLGAGIYQESVTITAAGGPETFEVPVTLTLTGSERTFSLSQNGFSFEVEQGSPAVLTRPFDISAEGSGTQQFSASATMISGANWLSVTPASGNLTAANPVTGSVRVNPAGLAAGQYHGQVEVRVDGAANSPQVITVVLNVLPANTAVAPLVSPAALILIQRRGVVPAPQTFTVTNVSARALPFTMLSSFEGTTPNWFSSRAQAASVNPGQALTVTVERNSTVRMPAGVHRGEIALRFGNGSAARVAVVLIVLPDAANAAVESRSAAGADGCAPTQLIPVFTTLGSGFSATSAWPTAIEMRVVDDCGDPLIRGTVSVSFTNGDPPLSLQPFTGGRWSGTWQPRSAARDLVLIASARSADTPALTGTARLGGTAAPNSTTPVINAGGILNAANRIARLPVSPGGAVTIVGGAFAASESLATDPPLPTDLGGTQVLLGSRRLALRAAAPGQIEAIIPYDAPPNATQQLLVRRSNSISMPESVPVAAALPAIYTRDGSGRGEAIAIAVKPDGTQVPVSAETPAAAGDELILSCTGLGPVDPAVPAGTAEPSDPRAAAVNPVTLTIGGTPVEVTFAGLSPGLAGIYQVNAIIPEGLDGGALEVILMAAGQASAPVTIVIQPAVP